MAERICCWLALSRDWLASFWYAQPCPSLFVETKSVRSSGSNAASILGLMHIYASPTSGEAYRDRQLTTNFEFWVEIFCVPTCFHVRIPKPCLSVCLFVCLSICPYPEKRNHHIFVNISPTLVIDTSMERSSRVLQHGNPKIWFLFSKKFEIRILTFAKSWNHHSFINISPTLIIDTSMERSSRVLQHGNIKIWFFPSKKKFEIEFRLVFCFTCFLFKFEIEFWLIFWLVLKSWNHSSRSQHAPICRHRGCIVVSSRVDIYFFLCVDFCKRSKIKRSHLL